MGQRVKNRQGRYSREGIEVSYNMSLRKMKERNAPLHCPPGILVGSLGVRLCIRAVTEVNRGTVVNASVIREK